MDVGTHALASYALARGFFSRRRWPVLAGMIFAGTVADIDLLSALFGPASYFAWHRTYTHSLVGTAGVVLLGVLFTRSLAKKPTEPLSAFLLPIAAAAVLHVVLDLPQSEGVAALWPFQPIRIALDWLPAIDFWVLAILILGIFIPELFRLITAEIGAKSKAPRGRNGAVIALSSVLVYVGARAMLHAGSVATLEPHSYHGESARAVGAYPDALSLFTWHGVVETQSFLCVANVPAGFGRGFDAESADCLPKPQPSPQLEAATKSRIAQSYIRTVPFPRALVAKTQDGYEVAIRSMRDIAEDEVHHRVSAVILLDSNFAVTSQDLVWAKDVSLR